MRFCFRFHDEKNVIENVATYVVSKSALYKRIQIFKLKPNVFSTLFDILKFRVQLAYENKEHRYPTLHEPNDSKLNEKPFGKEFNPKSPSSHLANTAQVRIELFALQIYPKKGFNLHSSIIIYVFSSIKTPKLKQSVRISVVLCVGALILFKQIHHILWLHIQGIQPSR